MTPDFLLCVIGTIGVVLGIYWFQQRHAVSEHRRRRNSAVALGIGAGFVGIVGFEQNVGLVHGPGLPEPLAFLAQASLLWLSFAGVVVAWYYTERRNC
jgi:hypothetical protein